MVTPPAPAQSVAPAAPALWLAPPLTVTPRCSSAPLLPATAFALRPASPDDAGTAAPTRGDRSLGRQLATEAPAQEEASGLGAEALRPRLLLWLRRPMQMAEEAAPRYDACCKLLKKSLLVPPRPHHVRCHRFPRPKLLASRPRLRTPLVLAICRPHRPTTAPSSLSRVEHQDQDQVVASPSPGLASPDRDRLQSPRPTIAPPSPSPGPATTAVFRPRLHDLLLARSRCLNAGAEDFIVKPLQSKDVQRLWNCSTATTRPRKGAVRCEAVVAKRNYKPLVLPPSSGVTAGATSPSGRRANLTEVAMVLQSSSLELSQYLPVLLKLVVLVYAVLCLGELLHRWSSGGRCSLSLWCA
ncbi:two-component response regulator ORR2-like [Miscanthus floridulus]|uniref:two-component response regulator ORR2-like n=1 Tax=Miscanthus floridulus TaxID=154761 RepID=UPI0034580A86